MNYADIQEKCKDDTCCFHRDGVLLTSDPPKYRLHCCQCGHMRYQEASLPSKKWGEHGPFYREGYH